MIYAVNRLTKEHRVVEERYSGGMRLPCRNPNLGKGWDYIQAVATAFYSGHLNFLIKGIRCYHFDTRISTTVKNQIWIPANKVRRITS